MSAAPDSKNTGSWHWKVADDEANDHLGLLYEPGNWGDVLKGTWAVIVARALAGRKGKKRLDYLDPFAGAPAYPLLLTAAKRFEWLRGGDFVRAQQSWIARRQLASTATLVREAAAEHDCPLALHVFDTEERFVRAWGGVPGATVLEIASGDEALAAVDADLVLADPYDAFDRWEQLLPALLEAAQRAVVLLYLYNKSPRGGGYQRRYRDLRRAVEKAPPGLLRVGRIPSDIILPRAFHEMMLFAPRSGLPAGVSGELRRATRNLACKMTTSGAFEEIR